MSTSKTILTDSMFRGGVVMLTADKNYSKIFHSPGLEPWVLGVLLRVKPNSMVDVGCGYGFWGFIAKRHINSLSYVVGLDLDRDRLIKAKVAYDDMVLADAKKLPFRASSFDAVLAIEVLHGLEGDKLTTTLQQIKEICKRVAIISFPKLGSNQRRVLMEHRLKKYRYLLRGFVLVSDGGEVILMYETRFIKFLRLLVKVAYPLLKLIRLFKEGYHLAIYFRE